MVWMSSLRGVQALGVDACNAYWAVSGPSEIHAQAK